MSEFTQILERIREGDSSARDALLPLVYQDLRRLAASKMVNEREGITLQPTALVHEAWLRLVSSDPASWQNRRHFFITAGVAMRRILIESARRKHSLKRGGAGLEQVPLDSVEIALPLPEERLLALDEALDRLNGVRPEAAEMVHLCFFAGLTQAQAAEELDVSLATAERLWAFARAWLFRELKQTEIEET